MLVKPNATVFLHATDDQEVIIVVNNCKGKYSTDCDGIDVYIVKYIFFKAFDSDL